MVIGEAEVCVYARTHVHTHADLSVTQRTPWHLSLGRYALLQNTQVYDQLQ
jgi:hypothetical protein